MNKIERQNRAATLRLLADIHDALHSFRGVCWVIRFQFQRDKSTEVQDDLRRWADEIERERRDEQ